MRFEPCYVRGHVHDPSSQLRHPGNHAWKRVEKRCELDDRSSCLRSHQAQLTPTEVSTIKEMVTATDYRHMPLRALPLYAQRAGQVFASATTWAKLVGQRG